jgi:hypothetical protein
MVGCAMVASRRAVDGLASMAVCITANTSPDSGPIIAKPRMRSLSAATNAFMTTLVSSRVDSQYLSHRQPGHAHRNALALRLAFADPDAAERRVGEQATGDDAITGEAGAAG